MNNLSNMIKIGKTSLKVFVFTFLLFLVFFNNKGLAEETQDCSKYSVLDLSNDSVGGKIYKILSGIPLIGSLTDQILFLVVASVDVFTDGFDLGAAFNVLSQLLGVMSGINSLPYQHAFGSNQYCSYQDIFKEEDGFLDSDLGRYSIFPAIPLDIKVGESGQCEFDKEFLAENFKYVVTSLGIGAMSDVTGDPAKSAMTGNPRGTNCAYSYTKYNDHCFLTNTLPVYIEAEAINTVSDAVCLMSTSIIKGGTSIAKQIGSGIVDAGISILNFLSQPIFNFDAYTLIKYYKSNLFMKLIDVVSNIISIQPICLGAIIADILSIEAVLAATADIIFAVQHDKAEEALQNLKFCGHNWYSYAGVNSDEYSYRTPNDSNYLDSEYFERGAFNGSYSYAVSNCISVDTTNECIKGSTSRIGLDKFGFKDGDQFIDTDDNKDRIKNLAGCNSNDNINNCIKPIDKTVYNKIYREFIYGGKEYSFESDYYDPRIPKYKGYYDVNFRFYMRGNEKANYACDRFNYGGEGCILNEQDYASLSLSNYEEFTIDNNKFYVVTPNQGTNNANFAAITNKCSELFSNAYAVCNKASKKYFCIESLNFSGDKSTDVIDAKFCKTNYESADDLKERDTLLNYMIVGRDEEDLCKVKFRNGNTSESVANLYAVKKYGGQYICVFTDNFCPHDFKLNAGLNYKDAYCGSDYVKQYYEEGDSDSTSNSYKYNISTTSNKQACSKGMFINNTCDMINDSGADEYKQYAFDVLRKDVGDRYEDDMEKIYKNLVYDNQGNVKLCTSTNNSNCTKKTAAFGKTRNYCQYKAHCVKVNAEETYDNASIVNSSAFMDISCDGKSTNSRNYIDVGLISTHTRQLSATVVECVYESLKNLVNGVAGYSSCKNGIALNDAGYCGTDTKELIEEKKKNGNSSYLNERYHFIKGYELPEEVNVAIKLRKSMRTIVLAFMSLSIMIWGFKTVVLGGYAKTKDFANPKFTKEIMITVIKFCLICWLALENGWRDGLADKIFNFTVGVYDFTSKILLNSIFTDRSTILKGKVTLGIEKIDVRGIEESSLMNFNYVSSFGLTKFSKPAGSSKGYNYITMSKNENISALTYFVNKLNNENDGYNYKIAVITDLESMSYDSSDISSIWNNNYDGCYFDTSEYEGSKTYLAIFDSLDCRIVRYLGITEQMEVGNLILIGLVLIFFGTVGGFILSIIMTFVFTVMNLLIEIVFTFINAFFTISLLIFVSPIILPLALFKKTENVFKQWEKKIISCVFQPVFVILTVLIFINILDSIILKNMTFTKHNIEGRYPKVECTDTIGIFCLINNVGLVFTVGTNVATEGFDLISSVLKTDSIDLENMPAISMLFDLLIIYILFMLGDSIMSMANSISSKLFGNSGVEGKSGKPGKMIGNSFEKAKSISSEASGYAKTIAGSVNRPFALLSETANKIGDYREKANQKKAEQLDKDNEKAKAELYKNKKSRFKKLADGFAAMDHYGKNFGKNMYKEYIGEKLFKDRIWEKGIKDKIWEKGIKDKIWENGIKKSKLGDAMKRLKEKAIDYGVGGADSKLGHLLHAAPIQSMIRSGMSVKDSELYAERQRAAALSEIGKVVGENEDLKSIYNKFMEEKFGTSDVDLSNIDMSKISIKDIGELSQKLNKDNENEQISDIINNLKQKELKNLKLKKHLKQKEEKEKARKIRENKQSEERLSRVARVLTGSKIKRHGKVKEDIEKEKWEVEHMDDNADGDDYKESGSKADEVSSSDNSDKTLNNSTANNKKVRKYSKKENDDLFDDPEDILDNSTANNNDDDGEVNL